MGAHPNKRLRRLRWNHLYLCLQLAVLGAAAAGTVQCGQSGGPRPYSRPYDEPFWDPFFYADPYYYGGGCCGWMDDNTSSGSVGDTGDVQPTPEPTAPPSGDTDSGDDGDDGGDDG